MPEKLAVIAICANQTELDGVSAALRNAGIEHVVRQRAAPPGSFEIAVRDADTDRADDIVNEIYGVGARDIRESEAIEPSTDVSPSSTARVCDACGSSDIRRTPKLAIFILAAVVAIGFSSMSDLRFAGLSFFVIAGTLIVLLVLDKWRCADCGHGWK